MADLPEEPEEDRADPENVERIRARLRTQMTDAERERIRQLGQVVNLDEPGGVLAGGPEIALEPESDSDQGPQEREMACVVEQLRREFPLITFDRVRQAVQAAQRASSEAERHKTMLEIARRRLQEL